MHHFIKSSIVLLSFIFSLQNAVAAQPKISSYVVQGISSQQMLKIADRFEVSRSHKNAYEVLVPETRRGEFISLAPTARILVQDISQSVREVFRLSQQSPLRTAGYHSFKEVTEMLNAVALRYPAIANLVQYGVSTNGKPLLALRVSNHLNDGKQVPRIMLTAATHGDEIITTEVLLNLMNSFLEGASTNPRFAEYLDKLEIVFIPVVNPDGFSEQDRYDNGSDPNRSYPFPENVNGAPTASINGIINFVKKYPLTGSVDFHAYGRLIMFPWGYTKEAPPIQTQKVFEDVTKKMATTNAYTYGQISRVIYVAKGSSADFYFWKFNALSLGIEIGDSKAPVSAKIGKYTLEQSESTWLFLDYFTQLRR